MHYDYKTMPETYDVFVDKIKRKNFVQKRKARAEARKAEAQESKNKSQEYVDYSLLMEELKELDRWITKEKNQERKAFFVYFQDAILSAYYRYAISKSKAWSKWRNIVLWISSIVVPVASGFVIQLVTEGNDFVQGASGIVIGSAVGLLWLLTGIYRDNSKKRAYDETWIRHSACYSRLHLNMSAFLTSDRSDDKYKEFVSNTFGILEQNLDQFVQNLSNRGTASRAKKG